MNLRRLLSTALMACAIATGVQAQVNVGSPTPPNSSAVLQATSTTKGFLPPVMTRAQRDSIVNPADGLMVYCTDCTPKCTYFYNTTSSNWASFCPGFTDATFTGGTLACSGTLGGIYQSGVPMTSGNTKSITITVATAGSFSATTNTVNGVTFSTSGTLLTAGTNTIKLQATGTPLSAAANPYTYLVTVGSQTCSFDVTYAATGNNGSPIYQPGDINVHDPCVFRVGSVTYAFSTGPSIRIRKTTDSTMKTGWQYVGYVWNTQPAWIAQRLGATPPDIWAPDVNFWNGKYYLYYAASIVGNGLQATMGLMTATNIEGPWTDEGEVTYMNYPIDPNVVWAGATPYMTWGSWGGVYIHEMDPATGKLSTTNTTLTKLTNGIEAATIFQDGTYFYLLGSKGTCCVGVNSTYYTVMGRSTNIRGPYTDKTGRDLLNSGGTTLIQGMGNQLGTGGGDWFTIGTDKYFGYHYYDGDNNGRATLNVRKINTGSDGWPILGVPIFDIQSGGTYCLINAYSRKGVTVPDSSTVNNTIVQQYDYSGMGNQKFIFTNLQNGYYRISPAYAPNLALGVNGTANSERVRIADWIGSNSQQWQITPMGSNYNLTNRESGKCMDNPGFNTTNNSQIAQFTCGTGTNQQFAIFILKP